MFYKLLPADEIRRRKKFAHPVVVSLLILSGTLTTFFLLKFIEEF